MIGAATGAQGRASRKDRTGSRLMSHMPHDEKAGESTKECAVARCDNSAPPWRRNGGIPEIPPRLAGIPEFRGIGIAVGHTRDGTLSFRLDYHARSARRARLKNRTSVSGDGDSLRSTDNRSNSRSEAASNSRSEAAERGRRNEGRWVGLSSGPAARALLLSISS